MIWVMRFHSFTIGLESRFVIFFYLFFIGLSRPHYTSYKFVMFIWVDLKCVFFFFTQLCPSIFNLLEFELLHFFFFEKMFFSQVTLIIIFLVNLLSLLIFYTLGSITWIMNFSPSFKTCLHCMEILSKTIWSIARGHEYSPISILTWTA
jgi:hypothetical protein